jgi:predicted HNH restriction endonuclease
MANYKEIIEAIESATSVNELASVVYDNGLSDDLWVIEIANESASHCPDYWGLLNTHDGYEVYVLITDNSKSIDFERIVYYDQNVWDAITSNEGYENVAYVDGTVEWIIMDEYRDSILEWVEANLYDEDEEE